MEKHDFIIKKRIKDEIDKIENIIGTACYIEEEEEATYLRKNKKITRKTLKIEIIYDEIKEV